MHRRGLGAAKSNKMKTMKRVFSLLLFFVAAMSVQTVQAQTNGDVNGDGKVNEQDIAAILEIMAEAGGVKEQTKYYWYVGQENPASVDESFNPEGVEGWTKLTSTPTSIKIFKETPDWSDVQWYLACPSEYSFDTSVNGIKVGGWDIIRNAVEIGGVMYDVWKCKALTDTVNTTLAKV